MTLITQLQLTYMLNYKKMYLYLIMLKKQREVASIVGRKNMYARE